MSSLKKILRLKQLTVTQFETDEHFIDYIYSDELLRRHILIEYDGNYREDEFYTIIAVLFYTDRSSGYYRMYADTEDDELVLKVYRIICDLVDFIEKTTDEELMDSLSSIAIGGFGSDARKELNPPEYERHVQAFTKLVSAIKEKENTDTF